MTTYHRVSIKQKTYMWFVMAKPDSCREKSWSIEHKTKSCCYRSISLSYALLTYIGYTRWLGCIQVGSLWIEELPSYWESIWLMAKFDISNCPLRQYTKLQMSAHVKKMQGIFMSKKSKGRLELDFETKLEPPMWALSESWLSLSRTRSNKPREGM